MAKYVIQWRNRDGLAGQEESGKRLLDLYTKWSPAASNISQFLSNVDGAGGLSIHPCPVNKIERIIPSIDIK